MKQPCKKCGGKMWIKRAPDAFPDFCECKAAADFRASLPAGKPEILVDISVAMGRDVGWVDAAEMLGVKSPELAKRLMTAGQYKPREKTVKAVMKALSALGAQAKVFLSTPLGVRLGFGK